MNVPAFWISACSLMLAPCVVQGEEERSFRAIVDQLTGPDGNSPSYVDEQGRPRIDELISTQIPNGQPNAESVSVQVKFDDVVAVTPDTRSTTYTIQQEEPAECPQIDLILPEHMTHTVQSAASAAWDLRVHYMPETCRGVAAQRVAAE